MRDQQNRLRYQHHALHDQQNRLRYRLNRVHYQQNRVRYRLHRVCDQQNRVRYQQNRVRDQQNRMRYRLDGFGGQVDSGAVGSLWGLVSSGELEGYPGWQHGINHWRRGGWEWKALVV